MHSFNDDSGDTVAAAAPAENDDDKCNMQERAINYPVIQHTQGLENTLEISDFRGRTVAMFKDHSPWRRILQDLLSWRKQKIRISNNNIFGKETILFWEHQLSLGDIPSAYLEA